LRSIAEFAVQRRFAASTPIVFEGNVAADPRDNDRLREVIQGPAPAQRPTAPRAWLGAAVAIKEPTHVVFHRQGGRNLLIVGQQEELALGILANCLISLAAQLGTSGPGTASAEAAVESGSANPFRSFYILDGTRPDSPEAGFWRNLSRRVTLDAEMVNPRDAAPLVRRIAAEVERRLAAGDESPEPIFLFIYNLSQFRDLKKSEDFGLSFGDDGDSAGAEKQLATILREGPALGIHTLIWSDSYNTLNRWLDRQTLRSVELRVLFQISANDSSNLMDSPAASRLGAHMAILYSEEQGQSEKFRPYGLPSQEWLTWVADQLSTRPPIPVEGGRV
jgi:hypothetical protein